MRASPFALFATLFILFSTFTAAWPWPRFLPEVDSIIVRRQDDGGEAENQAPSTTAPAKASATQTSASFDPDAQSQTVKVSGSMTITTGPSKPTGTNSSSDEDEDEENTESGSGSESGTNKSSSRRSTSSRVRTSTRKAYDPRYPAGGITMLEPAPTAAVLPLYKIGEAVSFKFSITSVSQYPTAVNVLATCTRNNALYTISANASFTEGKDKDVVWDTAQYGNTEPMLTSDYTLIIYDAEGNLEDIGESGYLAPFGNSRYPGFKFNMYEKRPYADEAGEGVKCATCSAAAVERAAKWLALGMAVVAVVGANVL